MNLDRIKDRNQRRAIPVLGLALAGLLSGCGQSSQVWVWTGASGDEGMPAGLGPSLSTRPEPRAAIDPGVAVLGRSAFQADHAPEQNRRDIRINARTADALPDRLAWPEAAQPDLRNTRSMTTSRNADRWVYPDSRRDNQRRRHTDFRAW